MDTVVLAHVFVSYRSRDEVGAAAAVGLARRLKRDLGDERAYYAPTDNRLTGDWAVEIERRLHDSNLVIAVIGPEWEQALTDPDRPTNSDWSRREVAYALATDDTDLLPIFVQRSGIDDPERLPADVRALATTHGVANFDLVPDYQSVLMQAWASFHAHEPDVVVVVSDATTSGSVAVAKLVAELERRGQVDVDRLRDLSQTVTAPPGAAVVPLREAAEDFPDIVVLEPDSVSERWRRRQAGLDAWVAAHPRTTVRVASAGGGLLSTVLPSLPSPWEAAVRWVGRRWRSLAMAGKAAVATVAAGGAVAAGAAVLTSDVWVDPEPVAFADFEWDLDIPQRVTASQAGSDPAEGHQFVAVDAAVTNPTTDSDEWWGGYEVVGLLADGARVPPVAMRNQVSGATMSYVDVPPGDAHEVRWIFELEDTVAVTDVQVELGTTDDRAIVIAAGGIQGAPPASPARLATTNWAGVADATVSLEVVQAAFALDAGTNGEGQERPVPPGGDRRADRGQAYLNLNLAITDEDGFEVIPDASVRVDGELRRCESDAPIWVEEETVDFAVTCTIPADAGRLVLEMRDPTCVEACGDQHWVSEIDPAGLEPFGG